MLALPYLNAVTGLEDSFLAAYTDPFAGPVAGAVNVRSQCEIMGAESYLRVQVYRGQGLRVDLLGGYQFSRLDDNLTIDVSRTVQQTGAAESITDVFDASNEFHGGGLGLLSEFYYRSWTLKALAKVSVGNMHETVTIQGSTTPALLFVPPDQGLFALATNSGRYERDETAAIPEFGLTMAYQLSDCTRLTLGYSLVYWNRIVVWRATKSTEP